MRSLALLVLFVSCPARCEAAPASNPFGFVDDTARATLAIERLPNGAVLIDGVEAVTLAGVEHPVPRPFGAGRSLVSDVRGGQGVLWDARSRRITSLGWVTFVQVRGAAEHDSLLVTPDGALLGAGGGPQHARVLCPSGFRLATLRHGVLEIIYLRGDALAINDVLVNGAVEEERFDLHGWEPVDDPARGEDFLVVRRHGGFGDQPVLAPEPTMEVGILNRVQGSVRLLGSVKGCKYPVAMNCCDFGYLEPRVGWSDAAAEPPSATSCRQQIFETESCASYTVSPGVPDGERSLIEHRSCR